MKILLQAVRAVSVELLGVLFVLWLLFGGVTWTLESGAAPQANKQPGILGSGVLGTLKNTVAQFSSQRRAEREQENVARRLEHYSRVYQRAALGYLKQVAEELSEELPDSQRPRQRSGHELLGAL